jgi:hypothetical protein
MISDSDKTALEKIIELDGDCMKHERCTSCPFKASCLPSFLTSYPVTKNQRASAALNMLSHISLMDNSEEQHSPLSFKQYMDAHLSKS